MQRYLFKLLIIMLFISCSVDENYKNCNFSQVKSGYDVTPNSPNEYYRQLFVKYEDENKIIVDVFDLELERYSTKEEYFFDEQKRLTKIIVKDLITTYANGLTYDEHVIFKFTDKFMTRTYLTISSENDTTYSFQEKTLYIKDPIDNKTYRFNDNGYNFAYTFKSKNLYKFGEYEVVENDTIDTFYGEYFYDDQPNTYFIPKYRATIPHEYYHSFVTSKNNLIKIVYYSGIDFDYFFNYDNQNKLTRYKGKSGLIVDFEYDCN